MAAPTYTEDLTDIVLAESGDTGWTNFTTNQQGLPSDDPDYPYIQGNQAWSQTCSKSKTYGNMGFDFGTPISLPTDGAFLIWQLFAIPTAIDDYAGTTTGDAGLHVLIGQNTTNYDWWYVGGSDISPNPYGGFQCHAVNTTVSPDNSTGTRTSDQVIGAGVALTSYPPKGQPHSIDAIRYGRCSAIFQLGESADPATFDGFAAVNDTGSNRWGLLQETAGGYLWQGRLLLGSTSAVYFLDSNKTIFIKWTPKVTTNFNTIEIQHADSYVSWTGITFQVLDTSTASRGRLIMTDPADVYIDQCTFGDMSTFNFDATSGVNTVEITNTTFRRCSGVYQGGATFNGDSFLNFDSTSSLFSDDLDLISNCSFESDGSNHAIELDANHAGSSFTLTNCTYTNYETSNGSTGNEPIYNNSGGHVTINVVGGDYPYYRNGAGATTTIIQTINWYFKIVDAAGDIVNTAEFRIYDSNLNQLFGVETSDGTELYQFDGAISGTTAIVRVHDLNYLHNSQTLSHPSTSNTAAAPTVIVLAVDRVYDNP